jgi:hypothetical protein
MRPLALLAALAVLAGCASSGGGEAALRSDTVRLGAPMSSSSAVGMRDFVVRAYANCPGAAGAAAPCPAESFRVVFSNVGQNALNSAFMGVSFEVSGGVTYTWDSGEDGFMILPNTYGEFLTIQVPRDDFEAIAQAEAVRVLLGGMEYLLTEGDRRSFVTLLERTATDGTGVM